MQRTIDRPSRHLWSRSAATTLLFTLSYALADYALNKVTFGDGWMILWPLNGVTIALLLMRPRRIWPAMLVGVVLGTGIGEFIDGNTLHMTIAQRLISLVEVLISASILPRFSRLDRWLGERQIFLKFLMALILGPGISGILAAILFHHVQQQPYLVAFNNWATSDALGIAATMPLALCLRSAELQKLFRPRALGGTLVILAAMFSVALLLFSEERYPLLFLLFPALLITDLFLHFSGSAISVFGICLIAVFMATHGHGTFGHWPLEDGISRDVALQFFLGFHILALFPASVLQLERSRLAQDLQETNAKLMTLASLDGLTGLGNRRSLDEHFTQEWNRAIRLQTPVALVMIDIDHFKQFNDLYGHPVGDECLKAVAAVLPLQVRRVQDHVARFGGEEFCLVLPHTGLEGARFVAEKVLAAVYALDIPHDTSSWKRVTVSVGCSAVTPALGDHRAGLLEVADEALYLAKAQGRNCIQICQVPKKREG